MNFQQDFATKISFLLKEGTSKDVLAVLCQLMREFLSKRVSVAQFVALLQKTKIENLEREKICNFILDIIWLEDVNASALPELSQSRKELQSLVDALLSSSIVTPAQVKEKMEPEFVEALESMTRSNIPWSKKIIRANTALLYKQQKFNLLREESEGYSKLITEVQCRAFYAPTPENIKSVLDIVNSLIGFFDLDPNRVLDIILDVFAENISKSAEFFIAFFKASAWYRSISPTKNIFSSLLGFKFDYYNSSAKKDVETPYTLCLAAAVLIKTKIVPLHELYPHLGPNDSTFPQLYQEHIKECGKQARLASRSSLLSNVVLSDDNNNSSVQAEPPQTEETPKVEEKRVPRLQKASVCESLLAVGDLHSALILLHRLPKLVRLNPQISLHLCRCIHYLIEPLYSKIRNKVPSLLRKTLDVSVFSESSDPFNPSRSFGGFARAFSGWSSSIEQIHDFSLFLPQIVPFLEYMGPALAEDISLATKICKLVKFQLIDNSSALTTETRKKWMDVVSTYLVPVVSLSDSNVGFINELWDIIKCFPYQTRFTLYGEWRNAYDVLPELFTPKSIALMETKRILRRISKENVKQFGRKLSKTCHSNPLISFNALLDQIQAYENLIIPLVDCLRYLTEFGFDVLVFALLEAFANPEKERLKSDGTNISLWLNSLAVFAGNLFKRHINIDLSSVLHYILYQGKDGNSLDLVILKEVVTKMSGIEQMAEGFSEQQLEALAGGETLKHEAIIGSATAKSVKKSSVRLIKSLLDSDLMFQFALLIAKQRNSCVFHTDINHVKLLSSLYDQVQETFLQYIDFLGANIDRDTFSKLCPDVDSIISDFGIDSEAAWFIARPKIKFQNDDVDDKSTSEKMEVDYGDETLSPTFSQMKNIFAKQNNAFISYENFIYKNCIYSRTLFYSTFWELTLSDIYVPVERYKIEILKQKQAIAAIDSQNEQDSKSKKEKDRLTVLVNKLELESNVQEANLEKITQRLKNEKDVWFSTFNNRYEIINSILQHCIRPRCLFSANDATYCARFVLLMHSMGTSNFSSLSMLDRIISDVSCLTFMCTQNEAAYFGRFLRELFSTLQLWHSNEETYNLEAKGESLPGFRKSWKGHKSKTTDLDVIQYEEFRDVMLKWQSRLYKAFLSCLQSKEYTKMRNSIIILDKISEYFPLVKNIAHGMEKKVQIILQDEKREDLKVLLTRYDTTLKKNRAKTIHVDQFHRAPLKQTRDSASSEPSSISSPQKASEIKIANLAATTVTSSKDESRSSEKNTENEVDQSFHQKNETDNLMKSTTGECGSAPGSPSNPVDATEKIAETVAPIVSFNKILPLITNGEPTVPEDIDTHEHSNGNKQSNDTQRFSIEKNSDSSKESFKVPSREKSPLESRLSGSMSFKRWDEPADDTPVEESLSHEAKALREKLEAEAFKMRERIQDDTKKDKDKLDREKRSSRGDIADSARSLERDRRAEKDRYRNRDDEPALKYRRDSPPLIENRRESKDTKNGTGYDRPPAENRRDDRRNDRRDNYKNDRGSRERTERRDEKGEVSNGRFNRRDPVGSNRSHGDSPDIRNKEKESPMHKRNIDYDGSEQRNRNLEPDDYSKRRKVDDRDPRDRDRYRNDDRPYARGQRDTYVPSYNRDEHSRRGSEDDNRKRRNVQIPASLTANLKIDERKQGGRN